ncbi:MAG: OmpH family outer membrane protein [Pararhodobacter sp.]
MRGLLAALVLAGALCAPVLPAMSQGGAAFAILDEERLLRDSALGRGILDEIRQAERTLEAENQQIFEQLAAEEAALTEARASLSPEAFRQRADDFDQRVEEIRAERGQRALELSRRSEAEAQRFFEIALPIMIQLMNEEGLVALLKPDALILGADWLDVTDAAIVRLDAATGSDAAPDDATPDDAHDDPRDAPPDPQGD